jgi:hypothetical protein
MSKEESRIERVKTMKPADFKRCYGVQPQTFDLMVKTFQEAQNAKQKAGRPAALSLEEQVIFTLEFWREYPTMFHHAFEWKIHESTGLRTVRRVEEALIESGAFSLPSKRVLLEELSYEIVVIDVTESPIERPKKSKDVTIAGKRNAIHRKVS